MIALSLGHPLPQAPAQRVDLSRVGHGEGQHGAAGAAGLAEDDHVIGPDGVEVAAGGDHVIHPAEDAQQVWLHGQCVVQLAGSDLVHPQASDGQVGVLQRLVLNVRDVLGQSVGPAAVAALGVGVLQALSGGVADRHVTPKRGHYFITTPFRRIQRSAVQLARTRVQKR
jgi:hypothetical protein